MSEEEFIRLKESLKSILRGYKKLNSSQKKRLRELGFSILRSKNHYILIYKVCDKELKIAITKTPSDSRSGIKTVKDISNVIKRNGLVKVV